MVESARDLDRYEHWAFVCEAADCRYRGAPGVREALVRAVHEGACANVGNVSNLAVVRTGCLGLCGAGPAVVSYPRGDVHLGVQLADAPELAAQLAAGAPLPRRAVCAPQWYRDRILAQLTYAIRLLKQRAQRHVRG